MENIQHSNRLSYYFIDHSIKPNYDWNIQKCDGDKLLEITRPCMFFHEGQTITLGKLNEYFTDRAIVKLEGDGYFKFL